MIRARSLSAAAGSRSVQVSASCSPSTRTRGVPVPRRSPGAAAARAVGGAASRRPDLGQHEAAERSQPPAAPLVDPREQGRSSCSSTTLKRRGPARASAAAAAHAARPATRRESRRPAPAAPVGRAPSRCVTSRPQDRCPAQHDEGRPLPTIAGRLRDHGFGRGLVAVGKLARPAERSARLPRLQRRCRRQTLTRRSRGSSWARRLSGCAP